MEENKGTVLRLACCVVVALVIVYGGQAAAHKVHHPLVEQYRPWLDENHVQAVAVVAAVLFGASTVVFPARKEEENCPLEEVPPWPQPG